MSKKKKTQDVVFKDAVTSGSEIARDGLRRFMNNLSKRHRDLEKNFEGAEAAEVKKAYAIVERLFVQVCAEEAV